MSLWKNFKVSAVVIVLVVLGRIILTESFAVGKCTVKLVPLSKVQMEEDFDYLIDMVKKNYPKLRLSKEFYKIDIIKKLQSFRNKIRGDETSGEFMMLIRIKCVFCNLYL